MSNLVSQCPKCKTSFSITPQQLQMANGDVRCGTCLHVFNAKDQYADTLPQHDNPAPTPEKVLNGKLDETFLDLEDWEEDPNSIFDDLAELDQAQFDAVPEDEEWAKALLDTELEIPKQTEATPVSDTPEPRPTSKHKQVVEISDYQEPEDFNSELDNPQDSPAITDDLENAEADNQPSDEYADSETDAAFYVDDLPAINPLDEILPEYDQPIITDDGNDHPSFTVSKQAPKLGLMGSSFALVLLLTLLGQYIYFNFDLLAKHQQWRPKLAHACSILPCQLPKQIDIKQVQTSNLVIRSHPKHDNALAIDAIITNKAGFDQPFPHLRFVFSDISGNIVAMRSFTPREYLQGEMANIRHMPAGSPVHIALEVVDPGVNAVNYRMEPVNSPTS